MKSGLSKIVTVAMAQPGPDADFVREESYILKPCRLAKVGAASILYSQSRAARSPDGKLVQFLTDAHCSIGCVLPFNSWIERLSNYVEDPRAAFELLRGSAGVFQLTRSEPARLSSIRVEADRSDVAESLHTHINLVAPHLEVSIQEDNAIPVANGLIVAFES
jgi:hypothetical protein